MTEKICVWLTRHELLPEIEERLLLLGYKIKRTTEYTFKSGEHAWSLANEIAGRPLTPDDVVFGILPTAFLSSYLELSGDVPLVRPIFNIIERTENNIVRKWAGRFIRTLKVEIITEEWN